MAKAFTVNIKYQQETYPAHVVTQEGDGEVFISAEIEDCVLHQVLPDGRVKAILCAETGDLKDPGQYNGNHDIVQSILAAIKLHDQKKRRGGLWS